MVPFGACKRCTKAQVPCETNTNSGSSKKKSTANDGSDTPEASSNTDFPSANDSAIDITPFNGSIFGTDASCLLDFDTFDFEKGDFNSLEETAISPHEPKISRGEFNRGPNGDDNHETHSFAALPSSNASPHLDSYAANMAQERPHDPRDDCMQRLLELHSIFFKDLHHITDTDITEALFHPNNTSIPDREANVSDLNLVQRILFASERLIELLTSLHQASTLPPPQPPAEKPAGKPANGFKRRYMHFVDDEDVPPTPESRAGSSFHRRSSSGFKDGTTAGPSRLTESSALLGRSLVPGLTGTPPAPSLGNNGASVSPLTMSSSPVDLPLAVSFLTCHVSLLSVYRTTFAQIQDVLAHSSGTRAAGGGRGGRAAARPDRQRLPMLLTSQHVLGIRIQMEVMTHMLERIEDAWAGALDEDEEEEEEMGSATALGKRATVSLLQSMLVHEGFEAMDQGDRIGLGSVIQVLKSIRRLLRNSNGL